MTATAADYRVCRRLNRRHGRTFYLATALLPPERRPDVHALYGFARYADDVVDSPAPGSDPAQALAALTAQVGRALAGGAGEHPVVRAMADTVERNAISPALVEDFLAAMTSDLTVTRYATFDDLREYMWGSACVIGLQLLPILRVTGDPERARRSATDLGIAFQLTNFLRDVGEDHRRGRIYLPQESLAVHGVCESDLGADHANAQVRELVRAEIVRARRYYASAAEGIADLDVASRDCVRTALVLYGEILDRIAGSGYDVLAGRATVGPGRRARLGIAGLARAVVARRGIDVKNRRPGRAA